MTDEGFTITRIFEAPRERVWREWTEPERFADWFGGPDGEVPPSTVSMDVRVGGLWKATMYYGPDRRVSHWDGGETLADRFRAHAGSSQHLYGCAMRGLADDWEAGGSFRSPTG